MTLLEQVTGWMTRQANKHSLGDNFAEQQINAMSQYDFLVAISEALDEMYPPPMKFLIPPPSGDDHV
jgi:hypothetical protein